MENSKRIMNKLIQIHPADNVLIVRSSIFSDDNEVINRVKIVFDKPLGLGHKIASINIQKGEQIIKYGVPIGSALQNIKVGEHIHLHNMKSDYIPTYTLDNEFNK